MDFAERFQTDKYLFVSEFLPPELARLASDYALLRQAFFKQVEDDEGQVPGTHFGYGDTLMETLLLQCQPKIETLTGLRLYPTYSYYRVYKPGDELKKHRDRRSCEISVTVCLGYDYGTDKSDYHWAICFDGVAVEQEPGDAVIYRGCELEHWREPLRAREQAWHSQVFLHYVDAAREDAPVYRYDQRPYVGAPAGLQQCQQN
jgi:hypothetical protein